jgi:hypothetical protein
MIGKYKNTLKGSTWRERHLTPKVYSAQYNIYWPFGWKHWHELSSVCTLNESKRQPHRASVNHKRHPSSLVGSVGKEEYLCNRRISYTFTKVFLDWLVHLQQGRSVGTVTPDDGQQMSSAPSRHTEFTVVGLYYRSVQNSFHSTDVYKDKVISYINAIIQYYRCLTCCHRTSMQMHNSTLSSRRAQ